MSDETIDEERLRLLRELRLPDPNCPWLDRAGRLIALPPGETPEPPPGVTWPKIGEYADDYGYVPSDEELARLREKTLRRRQAERTIAIARRPTECSAFQFRRLGRLATRLFDLSVRPPRRLRVTQLAVLAAVANDRVPGTIGGLAERLGMHRTTLSRSLTRLAEHGLVRLGLAPNDKRARIPQLTDDGRAALDRHASAWDRAECDFAFELGTEARFDLHDRAVAAVRGLRRRLRGVFAPDVGGELPFAFGAGYREDRGRASPAAVLSS